MSKLNKYEVDGVEFYVSYDKSQIGMSQRGLAKFCGIPLTTMQEFISSGAIGKGASEQLQALLQQDLPLSPVSSGGSVKLIPSELCVLIVEHFAFEKKNETALFAFRKFAAMGFSTWVLKVTGQEETKALSKVESLRQLQESLTKLIKIEEYAEDKPGLDNMLDYAKQKEEEEEDSSLITVEDILDRLGIGATTEEKKAIGMYAATAYRNLTGNKPPQVKRRRKQLNKKHQSFMVSAYPLDFIPVIENAINLGFSS